MKTILIIEDEKPAMERLAGLLAEVAPKARIVGMTMSVRQSVEWLSSHAMPDLILMDISLSDGDSFDIFHHIPITCPVIFTTAYDEYWQEAFEHNGIDYLLKPVRKEKLASALARYDQIRDHFRNKFDSLRVSASQGDDPYKKRFLVKRGSDLFSIRCEHIAYFYAADKLVCLVDDKGQRFVLDQSLADLEKQLDPSSFHRVNRKFIVRKEAIRRAKAYSKSKLLLEVEPSSTEDIIVPQESAAAFKSWFGS